MVGTGNISAVATEKSSAVATGKVLEMGCFDLNPRAKLLQSLTTWIEISEIKKISISSDEMLMKRSPGRSLTWVPSDCYAQDCSCGPPTSSGLQTSYYTSCTST